MSKISTNKKIFIYAAIVAIVVLLGGVFGYQYYWPQKETVKNPIVKNELSLKGQAGNQVNPTQNNVKDQANDWQNYTGQEIMGISFVVPASWTVKFREQELDPSAITSIDFSFYPPSSDPSGLWGGFSFNIYEPQPDVNKWIDKNLTDINPNDKNKLIINKMPDIGGKLTFNIDTKNIWVESPMHPIIPVILGSEYSYSYGFFQDGANDFPQIIGNEIFPNIKIK